MILHVTENVFILQARISMVLHMRWCAVDAGAVGDCCTCGGLPWVNDETRRPWEQRASSTHRTWWCNSGEDCFVNVWNGFMVHVAELCEMQFLGFAWVHGRREWMPIDAVLVLVFSFVRSDNQLQCGGIGQWWWLLHCVFWRMRGNWVVDLCDIELEWNGRMLVCYLAPD